MDNDFRVQFNELKPLIRKQWRYIIIIFIGAIPFISLVTLIFGKDNTGIFFFLYGLLYLYFIFGLLKFRCPNCSKRLHVTIYIGKIPFILQSWVSRNCNHCGVKLK